MAVGSAFKLVGFGVVLVGVGLGASTLLVEADASISVFMGLIVLAGLLIAVVGGMVMAVGALVGRGKPSQGGPGLSPEQRQLLDSQEFLKVRQMDAPDGNQT